MIVARTNVPAPISAIRIRNGFLWWWACQRGKVKLGQRTMPHTKGHCLTPPGGRHFRFASVLSRLGSDRLSDWKTEVPPLDLMFEIMEN